MVTGCLGNEVHLLEKELFEKYLGQVNILVRFNSGTIKNFQIPQQ